MGFGLMDRLIGFHSEIMKALSLLPSSHLQLVMTANVALQHLSKIWKSTLSDCPAMSFDIVCWQKIKYQKMKISCANFYPEFGKHEGPIINALEPFIGFLNAAEC